jgi:hypothetical protein
MENGSPVSMAIDPVDEGIIYVTPIYGPGGVWKSMNGGVDWVDLIPSTSPNGQIVQYNTFDSVSMDPDDHRHLVVGTHYGCNPPYAAICSLCERLCQNVVRVGPGADAGCDDGGM